MVLELLFWVIIAAIIATLVRPGNAAGQAAVDVVNAFAALVSGATGAAWQPQQQQTLRGGLQQ